MTTAPDTPRLAFTEIADAVASLRRRGLRLTTPRRLVLESLFAADGPVSAEHIAARLSLEVTSVYRNLETLERHGLTRHVHLGHGPGLHVLVGRGEREFLSCERCGAVRSLTREELDPVRDQIRNLYGYEARFTHFAVVGLCASCARGSALAQGHDRMMTGEQDSPKHSSNHEHSHGDHVHTHPHGDGLAGRHEHTHESA